MAARVRVQSGHLRTRCEKTAPGKGGEIQLTDAIRLLLKQGCKGLGVTLSGDERRFDIGNFDSYFRTFAEFAMSDPQYGPGLRKFVRELLDREGP